MSPSDYWKNIGKHVGNKPFENAAEFGNFGPTVSGQIYFYETI
jgi:hypothetical protein